MKILVIQLARLGDIYQTWPVMKALRRQFPEGRIDLLVRKKYRDACLGLDVEDRVFSLDTAQILGPSLEEEANFGESLIRLRRFLLPLKNEKYDKIINLSFSPLSSYLTHYLQLKNTEVRGYTRFSDGFLDIPDEASAYFYGQVGLGRDNRKHIVDVFADVAEVKLKSEDFSFSKSLMKSGWGFPWQDPYIVVHIGASQKNKSYELHKWLGVLSQLEKKWQGTVVLIGGAAEIAIGEDLSIMCASDRVVNLVGKTEISDLFPMIAGSELVVGCDSAPMHIASLTKTRCLNLSFSSVNFWETGPRSEGSWVIWEETPEELPSDRVVGEIFQMLNHEPAKDAVLEVRGGIPLYRVVGYNDNDFSWRLVKGIYDEGEFPQIENDLQIQARQRMTEINDLAIEQLNKLQKNVRDSTALAILDRADEIVAAIGDVEPTFRPLVRWYQTEKSRMGPGPTDELIRRNLLIHAKMKEILTNLDSLGDQGRPDVGGVCADRQLER